MRDLCSCYRVSLLKKRTVTGIGAMRTSGSANLDQSTDGGQLAPHVRHGIFARLVRVGSAGSGALPARDGQRVRDVCLGGVESTGYGRAPQAWH
jgi:hypothetical protein